MSFINRKRKLPVNELIEADILELKGKNSVAVRTKNLAVWLSDNYEHTADLEKVIKNLKKWAHDADTKLHSHKLEADH